MNLPDAPSADKGFHVTHFLTGARSARFDVDILGGTVVRAPDPTYIKLENSWLIVNSGGGPTP